MKKQGISLIVLIITIIVIIILATAVIQSFSNNNPIEKAKEAKEAHEKANLKESANINYLNWYSDSVTGNTTKTAEKYVKEELERQGFSSTEIEKVEVTENGVTIKETITFNKKSDLALKKEVATSNGEEFYIIGGDTVGAEISDNTQNIILLSKYNLKKENEQITLKQDTNGDTNACVFSSTNYWRSVDGITYPADLNNEEKYPIGSATSIITTAKEYGASLGVTGRLMTYEEANALKTGYSSILYGNETGYLYYWLGTASNDTFMYSVYGELSGINNPPFRRQRMRGPSSYNSLKVFNKIINI